MSLLEFDWTIKILIGRSKTGARRHENGREISLRKGVLELK